MSSYFELFATGGILVLIQILAALPWLYVIDPEGFKAAARRGDVIGGVVAGILVGGAALGWLLGVYSDPAKLADHGWWYGLVLHFQLAADSIIAVLGLLQLVWPRGGTVAQ